MEGEAPPIGSERRINPTPPPAPESGPARVPESPRFPQATVDQAPPRPKKRRILPRVIGGGIAAFGAAAAMALGADQGVRPVSAAGEPTPSRTPTVTATPNTLATRVVENATAIAQLTKVVQERNANATATAAAFNIEQAKIPLTGPAEATAEAQARKQAESDAARAAVARAAKQEADAAAAAAAAAQKADEQRKQQEAIAAEQAEKAAQAYAQQAARSQSSGGVHWGDFIVGGFAIPAVVATVGRIIRRIRTGHW